jgi:hypothetical protein
MNQATRSVDGAALACLPRELRVWQAAMFCFGFLFSLSNRATYLMLATQATELIGRQVQSKLMLSPVTICVRTSAAVLRDWLRRPVLGPKTAAARMHAMHSYPDEQGKDVLALLLCRAAAAVEQTISFFSCSLFRVSCFCCVSCFCFVFSCFVSKNTCFSEPGRTVGSWTRSLSFVPDDLGSRTTS